MATKQLLSQTGVVGSGPQVSFPVSDTVRTIQINPQINVGFTGSLVVEGSDSVSPGANDFYELVSVTFNGHTTNFSIDVLSSVQWVRARIVSSTLGAIAVSGSSKTGTISGSQGTGTPVTATIDSSLRIGVVNGTGVRVNAPVVPSFTTDDVVYTDNFNLTVTDLINGTNGAAGFQSLIGTITASDSDINILDGMAAYGLVSSDLEKLADTTATAADFSRLSGLTDDVQDQLDAITTDLSTNYVLGPGVDLTGLTASVADLNAFFDGTAITITAADVENAISGLTASAADLNVLNGINGNLTNADLVKLGDISASAAEIDVLNGFSGSTTDLNRIAGLTASNADLNAVTGLGATGVTSTELGHLSGLSTNVQTQLDLIPNLSGLTASANDLNLLAGASAGTGSYGGAITATEISRLDGVTSNIQSQLNAKRNTSDTIGVSEITGSAITTTELNYLQGVTSNVQTQINSISSNAITPTGGTFTGSIFAAAGTAAAPSIGFSPSTTSGFYWAGADGIGLTHGGSSVMTINSSDVEYAGGDTDGDAAIKISGYGEANPVYTFVDSAGNTKTSGMYLAGADSIGISAGGSNMATFDGDANAVTVGGAVASNNTVDVTGILSGEKMLGKATVSAGSADSTGETSLYVVPAGRNAIITKAMVRIVSAAAGGSGGDTSVFRMNIGWGASFDELLDNVTNTTVFNPGGYSYDTAGQIMPIGTGDNTFPAISGNSGASYQFAPAGTDISASVTVLADFDTWDVEVILFGYEYA